MEESIFTKIIQGNIPAHKIYEDDHTLAFLDINPARYGHTLVIPKIQVDKYFELPDDQYDALWRSVKKVAARLDEQLDAERIGVLVKGFDVPHAHVHLIPINHGQDPIIDENSPKMSNDELRDLAEKLRF